MVVAAPARWWRKWWRGLSPTRQDRFAALAPLAAVLMFLAAIVAAFWYLRAEDPFAVVKSVHLSERGLQLTLEPLPR